MLFVELRDRREGAARDRAYKGKGQRRIFKDGPELAGEVHVMLVLYLCNGAGSILFSIYPIDQNEFD
jgi:hypothetical protein